ncbi:hypothetical protein J6590_040415 [Homalodisca vitripennis]|nr:hypothetical protein J6590_040415 [Homalodisca vitripennis]
MDIVQSGLGYVSCTDSDECLPLIRSGLTHLCLLCDFICETISWHEEGIQRSHLNISGVSQSSSLSMFPLMEGEAVFYQLFMDEGQELA